MGRLIYVHAFVYDPDRLLVGSVDEDLEEDDVAHAIILRWVAGTWDRWDMATRLAGHVLYDGSGGRTFLGVGIDGEYQMVDRNGPREAQVDSGEHGPSALRHLRVVTLIGEHIYVAGMQRQVYRMSKSGGPWERFDAGLLVPRDDPTIAGLWDIDGFSSEHLYAPGLRGELWRYEDGSWLSCDPPTNAGLYAVVCCTDEQVYVAGDQGIVLRGRGDQWLPLTNDVTDEAFWSMAEFKGVVYLVTSERGLFRINGDSVEAVDLPFAEPPTMRRLHTDGNVLLAVGSRDVTVFDGSHWRSLDPPRE